MAQLTLQVDSPSLLEQLKNVLSLIKGVKIVSGSPISRRNRVYERNSEKDVSADLCDSVCVLVSFIALTDTIMT